MIAAATAAAGAVIGGQAGVAAAAEQDQQNDDPAQIPTAKTVVTHSHYLREDDSTAEPFIP